MSENTPEQPTPATGDPNTPPPAPPADQQPPAPPAQETEVDWKAMARQWEKRAKENSKAADELDKLRKASMSEQEKAVAEAEARGKTTAAQEYGHRLAAAEFRAAVAAKGLNLGEAADLIDSTRFVDDKGDVDEQAIRKAVDKLSKILTPKAPSSSGGDFGGGNGGGTPPKNLDAQIAEARAKGDWRLVMRLENSKLAAAEAQQ
ncbi:hypothetical protein [Nonomuraea indica]|uniref:hypothetical protein n=1 Tax=Nonomuraea indica TaxID=1581193 RepID=UPI000C797F74|nr:hypothetical protein [Nonomuraea indica]